MSEITTVALAKLVPSADNVRRVNSEAGIAELAAAISSNGQLQNLNVRKAKGGRFEVVAGARRFAAFRYLLKEGGSVKGVPVTKDFPVRIALLTDERDLEVSLVENIQRSAMHPADEIEAFRTLNEREGMRSEEIAARFGISHMTVRRRLKLSTLSPRLLEELRTDAVTLEQAEALSISTDHAAQERAWFEASHDWNRQPHALKQQLTKESVPVTSKLAKFVGIDAYREMGGPVEEDLFSSKDGVFLTDRALVVRLAENKLKAVADEARAEGWSWTGYGLDAVGLHAFRRIYPETLPLSEESELDLKRLGEEYAVLEEQAQQHEEADEQDEEAAALFAKIEEIEAQIARLGQPDQRYTDEQKALAGAFVHLDYNGAIVVVRGIVRQEDEARLKTKETQVVAADCANDDSVIGTSREPEPIGFNGTLTEELTAIRAAALRCELIERPQVALVALLHPLALRLLYDGLGYNRPASAVEIEGEWKRVESSIKEPESCRAFTAWTRIVDSWKARVPNDQTAFWDWLMDQTMTTLTELLSVIAAANLNAVRASFDGDRPGRINNADLIADAVALDMRRWWSPEREFLSRISKGTIANVMKEAGLPEGAAADIERLSKSDAVNRAELDLAGRGWLPAVMKSNPAPRITEQDETGKDDVDDVRHGEDDEGVNFADDGDDEAQALASIYGEDTFADAAE